MNSDKHQLMLGLVQESGFTKSEAITAGVAFTNENVNRHGFVVQNSPGITSGINVKDLDLTTLSKLYDQVLSKRVYFHEYSIELGGLNCAVRSNCAEPLFVGVVIHGLGATSIDVIELITEYFVKYPSYSCAFVFPNAPRKGIFGRQWWSITSFQSLLSYASNYTSFVKTCDVPCLAEARNECINMIYHVTEYFDVPFSSIGIFGFSQGGVLALDLLLHLPYPPFVLGLWSTLPMYTELWKSKINDMSETALSRIRNTPIFVSHGFRDPTIPFFNAKQLLTFLNNYKFRVEKFSPFKGYHEIPESVAMECWEFMNQFLSMEHFMSQKLKLQSFCVTESDLLKVSVEVNKVNTLQRPIWHDLKCCIRAGEVCEWSDFYQLGTIESLPIMRNVNVDMDAAQILVFELHDATVNEIIGSGSVNMDHFSKEANIFDTDVPIVPSEAFFTVHFMRGVLAENKIKRGLSVDFKGSNSD